MNRAYQNELISVVVPVYNVEKYLERCLDSLINQTYENLEIILVDDGAKDNSGKICDTYALKDSRIRVLHKENGGLSDARNKGIDMANGEYIGFVDSDDYVSPFMYERLLYHIKKTESDIAICQYQRFEGDFYSGEQSKETACREMDTLTALKNMYGMDGECYTVAWNKLYRRECISDIRYPVRRINEDEFTTYKFIANAKKIAFTDEILYYYFYNNDSITTKNTYLSNKDVYAAIDERIVYLEEKGLGQIESMAQRQYLDRIISRNKVLYKCDRDVATDLWKMYQKRYRNVKKMIPGMAYLLYMICPQLYYFLLKIKERR